jgi:hypothetical protein
MRHILAVLTLGATLALGTSAAFAYGDKVDYVGPQNQATPAVVAPASTQDSGVIAGPAMSQPWWTETHYDNFGR